MERSKTQFARLLKLDELIRDGSYPNRRTFAADWEVSEKTVQRDVDYLRDQLNAPIEYDREHGGYVYTEDSWFMPSLHMNEGELFSLVIARLAVEQYRGTPVARELERIFARMAGTLTEKITIDPAFLSSQVSFTPVPALSVDEKVWNALLRSLRDGRTLNIRYKNATAKQAKEQQINPYHLANLQGEWYVFAGTPKYVEARQYSVGRIQSAEATRMPFDVPKDFDPKSLLSNVFGRFAENTGLEDVTVLIKAKMVPYVGDRQWHPKQKIRSLPDGDIEITFPVSSGGPWPFFHVISWILSLGSNARIIRPPALKKLVENEARSIQEMYTRDNKPG